MEPNRAGMGPNALVLTVIAGFQVAGSRVSQATTRLAPSRVYKVEGSVDVTTSSAVGTRDHAIEGAAQGD